MKKLSLLLFLSLSIVLGFSQEILVGWTFDNLSPSSDTSVTPKVIQSNTNWGNGTLYADGTNGSSDYNNQTPELNAFNGTTLNDPRTSPAASKDLAVVGNSANGKSIVFKFSMSGYQNLQLSYAQRGSEKGYKKEEVWYSVDGETFIYFDSLSNTNSSTYAVRNFDFTSVSELNDAEFVYIKITFYGATTASGNNRIDNVIFRANPGGPDIYPPKIMSLSVENPTTLKLIFNEALNQAIAETTDNYFLEGHAFANITCSNKTVVLTPSPALEEGFSYSLIVNNIEDLEGNVMTPDTQSFSFGTDQQYHVSNIAELRSKWTRPYNPDSVKHDYTKYKLTGSVIVTATNDSYRNQIFIQDGTAAIVIDDENDKIKTILEIGDEIKDIYGTLTSYYGLLQFVVSDVFTANAISNYNEIEPLVVSLSDMQNLEYMHNHQCKLIRLEDVTFVETGTFQNGKKYNLKQNGLTGTGVWTHIYGIDNLIGTPIPTTLVTLTGVNKVSYDNYYLIPRSDYDISTTGIEDFDNDNYITIYPNPVTNLLTATSNNTNFTITHISIYDINGKLVIDSDILDNDIKINVSSLASGQYFLKIYNDNKFVVKKFVKE